MDEKAFFHREMREEERDDGDSGGRWFDLVRSDRCSPWLFRIPVEREFPVAESIADFDP